MRKVVAPLYFERTEHPYLATTSTPTATATASAMRHAVEPGSGRAASRAWSSPALAATAAPRHEVVGRRRDGHAEAARGEEPLRDLQELLVLAGVERRALLEALAADGVDVLPGPELGAALVAGSRDRRGGSACWAGEATSRRCCIACTPPPVDGPSGAVMSGRVAVRADAKPADGVAVAVRQGRGLNRELRTERALSIMAIVRRTATSDRAAEGRRAAGKCECNGSRVRRRPQPRRPRARQRAGVGKGREARRGVPRRARERARDAGVARSPSAILPTNLDARRSL